MAYRTVKSAVDAYMAKYNITTAIHRSQQCKAAAKKQSDYDFWCEVEEELQKIKLQLKLQEIKKQPKKTKTFEE